MQVARLMGTDLMGFGSASGEMPSGLAQVQGGGGGSGFREVGFLDSRVQDFRLGVSGFGVSGLEVDQVRVHV